MKQDKDQFYRPGDEFLWRKDANYSRPGKQHVYDWIIDNFDGDKKQDAVAELLMDYDIDLNDDISVLTSDIKRNVMDMFGEGKVGTLSELNESWDTKYDDQPINQWGEKWQSISGTWLNSVIDDIIKDVQIDPFEDGPKLESLSLGSLYICEDGHLIATIYGGANGGGFRGEESNWKFYLSLVRKFLGKILDYNNGKMFKDVWMIDWDNDCCDDVWTLRLGLELVDEEKMHLIECGKKFSIVDPTKLNISLDAAIEMITPCQMAQNVQATSVVSESSMDLDNLVLNIVDDDLVEEGIGKLVSYGLLTFLLGSAGIVEGAALDANMEKLVRDKQVQQGGKVTITKTELKDVIERSKKKSEKVGKWELAKAKNLLARTLYMESREDGEQGINLSMTVIWNRAGGMKEHFVSECLRPSQFSCWNDKPSSEKNPTTYQIQFPSCVKTGKGQEFDLWNKCVEITNSAYAGTFVPVDSHWNAYYNPKKCHPYWASQLIGAKTVGHHIVGELKDQTRHAANLKKSQKTKMYVVQPGDTLWKIAGKDTKKVDQLKALNNLKSDSIHPGMKLKLA